MDENELEDEDTLLDEEDDTPPEMPDEDDSPPDKPEDDIAPTSGGTSSVTWNGATVITEGGSYDNQKYTSTTANQNALLIYTSANVTLNNPTVTKSGGGDAIMMGSIGFMIYAYPTLKVIIISVVVYIVTVIAIVISKGAELDRRKRLQLPYAPFVGIGYAVTCIM